MNMHKIKSPLKISYSFIIAVLRKKLTKLFYARTNAPLRLCAFA